MERLEAFALINEEREAQTAKWGEQNHKLIEWMAILYEEVGELSREALEYHFVEFYPTRPDRLKRIREELVQVAAVCVQMLEKMKTDT